MDLIPYLNDYVNQKKGFNAGSHNGRPMGQGDINSLLSSISNNDFEGVHSALLNNLASKRPIDQLILLKQRIDGHTVATSPLCLALAEGVSNPIVRYLLLILIYMGKLRKIGKFHGWRGNKDECPNMGEYLGYDLLQTPEFKQIYDDSIQAILMVEPRWTQKGGRRTRYRKHRSRKTRRHRG